MKLAILSILTFFCLTPVLRAQELDESYETLLLKEEENITGMAFKPIIGAGIGVFSFFGDVTDYFGNPMMGMAATRFSIGRTLGNNFEIEFHGSSGKVTGNAYDGHMTNQQNFQTDVFLGGFSVFYNFNHILKRKRPIHPYVSLGGEILQFTPKGDLEDANGNPYYYWDDGTMRDVAQSSGATGNFVSRDYVFESDLRDLNEDGIYSKTSFAIPLGAGLNVTVSDRVTCRVGTVLHITGTDYVDNVREGFNDIIMNTYVGMTFDLFSAAEEIAAVENFRNLKFMVTDGKDYDFDGVDDFNDECPGTPAEATVDFRGCPVDTDKDGVPDYKDLDNETPLGTLAVGSNGIKIMDEQVIAMLYDPETVERSDRKLYAQKTVAKEETDGKKEIPAKFKPVDTNGDKYISHEELQEAIDSIFEGNSTLTPGDIYELQEFFFNQ